VIWPSGRLSTPVSGDRSVVTHPIHRCGGGGLERLVAWECACSMPTILGASAEPWTSGLSAGPSQQKGNLDHIHRPRGHGQLCPQLASGSSCHAAGDALIQQPVSFGWRCA
jgi:hypothetical protein